MTPLRTRMLEELKRRNYSDATQRNYTQQVALFARYFKTSPDRLGEDHIRQYQLHLLERSVSWSYYNVTTSALRFFFGITLGKKLVVEQIPYGKRPKTLPVVLGVAEVLRLIDAAPSPKYRALFATIYACALRLNEARLVRVSDIDGEQRLLHVRAGKGQRQRPVPLSEKHLEHLRAYWRTVRSKEWLFPGTDMTNPISKRAIQRAFVKARTTAGINKSVGPHSLRHSCATHLLEAGTDIRIIQKLLGHAHLQTTLIYTQVTTRALQLGAAKLEHLDGIL